MDALALLKKDHQTVEKLFARFEKKPSKETADRFVRELSIHAAVEERLFYPALRKLAQSEQLEEVDEEVLEALEEHHVAKWVLSEIEGLERVLAESAVGPPRWFRTPAHATPPR